MATHFHHRPSNKRHLPLSALPNLNLLFSGAVLETWGSWRRQPRPRRRRCNIETPHKCLSACLVVRGHCVLPVELVPHFHHPTTLCIQPGGPIHLPRPPSSASRLPPSVSQDGHAAGPLSLSMRLHTLWIFAKSGARVEGPPLAWRPSSGDGSEISASGSWF